MRVLGRCPGGGAGGEPVGKRRHLGGWPGGRLPAPTPAARTLQNTKVLELLWIFWILLALLLFSRAAFVVPVTLLHNRFSQHKLSNREMVVIWWVPPGAGAGEEPCGEAGASGARLGARTHSPGAPLLLKPLYLAPTS